MRAPYLVCGFVAVFAAACDSSNTPAPATGGSGGSTGGPGDGAGMAAATMSFFVSSDKSSTGNLGGLAGADARCSALAKAAGSTKTWHAYLSVEHGDGGGPIHARDRIGVGPWVNSKGVLLANDLAALHARTGDADVFLDEHGAKINGQWPLSPPPVEHDVLTGSNSDGTVMPNMTCADWTSAEMAVAAQVGHSDGLGPGQNSSAPFSSWNSAHANGGCDNTTPKGGAGRIYCFAVE